MMKDALIEVSTLKMPFEFGQFKMRSSWRFGDEPRY